MKKEEKEDERERREEKSDATTHLASSSGQRCTNRTKREAQFNYGLKRKGITKEEQDSLDHKPASLHRREVGRKSSSLPFDSQPRSTGI